MDSNHIRIAYTAAQELIALLSSSYGETLKADRPDLITQAEDAIKKYQALYMEDIVTEKAELIPLLNEIAEIKSALKVISPSSLDSIKTLTELENANAKSLQDALLFDPTLFYNKYALNLASPTTQTLVHTPEENERFNLWFGSSKVVDSEGKPLVVYHGTGGLIQDYNEFKFSPFPAAYFAENKSYSEWFATYRGGTNIMHNCYLKVQNPIDITAFGVDLVSYHDFVLYIKLRYGYDLPENIRIKTMADASGGMWAWRYLRNGADWIQYIHRKNDFDGVVYYENNPSDKVEGVDKVTKAWMVFDGSQIKSADIRNTTYSLSSKNIAMKRGGQIEQASPKFTEQEVLDYLGKYSMYQTLKLRAQHLKDGLYSIDNYNGPEIEKYILGNFDIISNWREDYKTTKIVDADIKTIDDFKSKGYTVKRFVEIKTSRGIKNNYFIIIGIKKKDSMKKGGSI